MFLLGRALFRGSGRSPGEGRDARPARVGYTLLRIAPGAHANVRAHAGATAALLT
ncbi:hypothetical protein [Streptomyces sp. NBC_01089]|uniref:hypothetical protein n=1 Tax=Streptomyces sp. NBC_01089 TaxID=2903747 RepID=UPI0038632463